MAARKTTVKGSELTTEMLFLYACIATSSTRLRPDVERVRQLTGYTKSTVAKASVLFAKANSIIKELEDSRAGPETDEEASKGAEPGKPENTKKRKAAATEGTPNKKKPTNVKNEGDD
ncbi:hypothetical protein UCRPC4_g06590 [Phaeomoniella chlamydospora]|uniref:Uncharacterized protein n=1 Tax=Phaeomoniella chlamydospora TaxID=158046 RepID=A0A0G2GCY7_PHACM|nr:hypothetical protein UCRPC4_g06590 [Phaeomoniella chlamydospora]